MQTNLSIDHSSQSFHEASRLIFRFTLGDDRFERSSWRYREGSLVDRLVARIELWNDEVAGRPEGEHSSVVSIVVRAESGKTR